MRWYLKMFTHALRSMRLMPAWSVDVHEVQGWVVGDQVACRHFWTEAAAVRWADERARTFGSATYVCFVCRADWFHRDEQDGQLCLNSDWAWTITPEGLELDWGRDDDQVGVRACAELRA